MTIFLVWPDGHASHGGQHYADLPEALDVLNPKDYFTVAVIDHTKQETSNV